MCREMGLEKRGAQPPEDVDRDYLSSLWLGLFELAERADESERRPVYDEAARLGLCPSEVVVDGQRLVLASCYVATSDEVLDLARRAQLPAVLLAQDAADLWIRSGALDAGKDLKVQIDNAEEVLLVELEPALAMVLKDSAARHFALRGDPLNVRIGAVNQAVDCLASKGVLYVNGRLLMQLPWDKRVERLLRAMEPLGWLAENVQGALTRIHASKRNEHELWIASGGSLAERLLRAVGEQRATLIEAITELESPLHPLAEMDGLQLAGIALSLHGATVLRELEGALRASGLRIPRKWWGEEAAEFVARLNFPPEFAMSAEARRDPELWATGPMPLGVLHDYQNEALRDIEKLFDSSAARRRGMLCLPTGAGKTRVAVEACVGFVLKRDDRAVVLWVADADELCEQAVMAFRQVWANSGKPWQELRVVRLWGGQRDPIPTEERGPTVIVSTYQTLNHRTRGDALEWLQNPNILVIDEAHRGITPSYTGLLQWLDEGRNEGEAEPPVLGLSATPFRKSDEESPRLARRFDHRLIPAQADQEGLHQRLVEAGVLSTVATKPLPFGEPVVFTDRELEHIRRFQDVPESVLARLAASEARNRMIIDYVEESTAESIILFAASVSHAKRLAARLTLKGIGAAAISGETAGSSRRYFIREFKAGRTRVLCNFGVLATGFDAPKTDLILIARPVMSPVLFMQMVGRGLRGQRNGGTANCTVATVLDNFVGYSGRTAVDFFRGLYA